jgi:hypothetical protein
MLSAAVAVCVYPAAALPQYPGAPRLWPGPRRPPEQNLGPNNPSDPGSPFGLRNPYDPQRRIDALNLHGRPNPFGSDGPPNPFGSPGTDGPHGILPPEPRPRAVINQGNDAAPNPAPTTISPDVAAQLQNAGKIGSLPNVPPFVPAPPPGPGAAPPGPDREWLLYGLAVLCMLALLLLGSLARKPQSVPPEGADGERL